MLISVGYLYFGFQVDRKASEEAARSVERKAVKVHDDRQNKENAQKRNIKK